MRKFILIAGIVLASASAQAGDNRSLSLAGSDTQPAAAPAKTNAAPQTAENTEPPKAEAPRAADAPKADAPKYVERPAIVETKPERYRDEPRYKEESRYRDEPRYYDRPRRSRSWTERRIINALHRHGIYW